MDQVHERRCGASMPDKDAAKGWHFCYHPASHTGMHEDDHIDWYDGERVWVTTVAMYAVVPDHEHDFPHLGQDGDAQCAMDPECQLTWNEYQKQQEWWRQKHADMCSFCGHTEECHNYELSDEGGRDYCAECRGADEYHAFNEGPTSVEVTRERLMEVVRGLLGPDVPQGRLEDAVDRMRAMMLALTNPESVPAPLVPEPLVGPCTCETPTEGRSD